MTKKKKSKLDRLEEEIANIWGPSGSTEKKAREWGIPKLDEVLGGMPKGVVEVYGQEGIGKTTLLAYAIKAAQNQSGSNACVFVDAEHSFSATYYRLLGVDTKRLIVREENVLEDVFDQIRLYLELPEVGLVVLDSLPALVPKSLQEKVDDLDEGAFDKIKIAQRANFLSNALPSLFKACKQANTTLVILNHIREKIGIMFGNPITTPGGHALKHLALQRIEMRNMGQIKKSTQVIGRKVKIIAVKNKIAKPMIACELNLIFGEGFTDESK